MHHEPTAAIMCSKLLLLLCRLFACNNNMQRKPVIIVVLCLVTLISSATSQEAAEPSAALDPAVAAELLPGHMSDATAESAALMPLSEAAKAQLVESMMVGVQASKDEVKQALANPTAAFEQYSARWASGDVGAASVPAPGSAADTKTLTQRKRIFLANLRVRTTLLHGL